MVELGRKAASKVTCDGFSRYAFVSISEPETWFDDSTPRLQRAIDNPRTRVAGVADRLGIDNDSAQLAFLCRHHARSGCDPSAWVPVVRTLRTGSAANIGYAGSLHALHRRCRRRIERVQSAESLS